MPDVTTTPDPKTVREIARQFLTDPDADELKYVVRNYIGYAGGAEHEAWCDAVRADAENATVTTTASWPDERDACGAQLSADSAARLGASPDATCTRPAGHATHDDGNGVLWVSRPQDERDSRIAELERELRELRGTELNPSPLMLDAQAYNELRDEIAATMGDEWDLDEAEISILIKYVRWLAAGQPRDEDGYPIRRKTYPQATTEQPQDDGDVRAVALLATVSGVCTCSTCEVTGRSIYRMIGKCLNCASGPILMLFRTGDDTRPLECPFCGCGKVVAGCRATDDEIPAAAEAAALEARDAKAGE